MSINSLLTNEVVLDELTTYMNNRSNIKNCITQVVNYDGNLNLIRNQSVEIINLNPTISMQKALVQEGNKNVAVGSNNIGGGTKTECVAYGNDNLTNNLLVGSNIAVGNSNLNIDITGSQNIAVGNGNLLKVLTGNNNIAIGNSANFNPATQQVGVMNNTMALGNSIVLTNNKSGMLKLDDSFINTSYPASNEFWFGEPNTGHLKLVSDVNKVKKRVLIRSDPQIATNQSTPRFSLHYTTPVSDTLTPYITYVDSAVIGDSFVVNIDGIYSIQALIFGNGYPLNAQNDWIDLNGTDTTIGSPLFIQKAHEQDAGTLTTVTYTGPLVAGDVVRIKSNILASGVTANVCRLFVTLINETY